MKKDMYLYGTIVSIFAAVFVSCSGCAGKGQLNPTTGVYDSNAPASTVVVGAETFRETALNAFDAFTTIEKEHEATLKVINPEIHKFAELVRRDSKGWLDDLTAAKLAYQRERTVANENRLRSATAMVDSMLSITMKHLAQSSKGVK